MWEWLGDEERTRRTAVLGEFLARRRPLGPEAFIGKGASLTTITEPRYAYLELTESPERARAVWLENKPSFIQADLHLPNTPPDVLVREAQRLDHENDLLMLAANIALPPEGFVALSCKRQMRVREKVASSPWCLDTVLLDFAQGDSEVLSARAAGSLGLPTSEFFRLSEQGAPRSKATLAANPMTPTELVVQACTSKSKHVRQAAATNVMLSAELCQRLSDDKNVEVRVELASNPATPNEILVSMTKDDHEWVRAAIAGRSLPGESLAALAVDRDVSVRFRVAENKNTPVTALLELSVDSEARVRQAVHGNPNTPDDARTQAAKLGIELPLL